MTRVSAWRRDAVTGRRRDHGYSSANRALAMQRRARQVHFNDALTGHSVARRVPRRRVARSHSPPRLDRRSSVDPRGRRGSRDSYVEPFHAGMSAARHPRRGFTLLRPPPLSPHRSRSRRAARRVVRLTMHSRTGRIPQPRSINPHRGVSWPRSIYRSREESGGGCPKQAARTSQTERARRRADGRTNERLRVHLVLAYPTLPHARERDD